MNTPQDHELNGADPAALADLLAEGLRESKPGQSSCTGPAGEPGMATSTPDIGHIAVPGYELIRQIGRGGMGRVFEALQLSTQRTVAVKVMLEDLFATEIARQRFEREVRIAAGLRHPHIVQVYDSGLHEGRYWFAMELAGGRPLDNAADLAGLSLRQRLSLMALVCEAVGNAHARNIVHRDLKPSNILVDANGEPHILDFGLAKVFDPTGKQEFTLSVPGSVMGTLAYMSPEQVAGQSEQVDARSDVYSLGVILFRLLTGKFPYSVSGRLDGVVHEIATTEPIRPSRVNPTIESDVEAIMLKAISKEPRRRYATAADLARDIRSYLVGKPVEARRDSVVYILRKNLRRYRTATAIGGAFAVLSAAAFAISLTMWRQADTNRAQAEAALDDLRRVNYARSVVLAHDAFRTYHMDRMRGLLDGCPTDLRGWEWGFLKNISDRSERTFFGHIPGFRYEARGGVRCAAIHPSGRLLVSAGRDATLRVWDLTTGQEAHAALTGHEGEVLSVALSPDGNLAASGGADNTVRVWNLSEWKEVLSPLKGHTHYVVSVAFSPDGKTIASGSLDHTIRVWDVATGVEVSAPIMGHNGPVRSVTFNSDGSRIISASGDRTVRLWDIHTGAQVRLLDNGAGAHCAVLSFDGRYIAACARDGNIHIWDADTGTEVSKPFVADRIGVGCAAFSHDGRLLVAGGMDRVVRIWDLETGECVRTLRGHLFPITCVLFTLDDKYVVSASEDSTLKLWGVDTPEQGLVLPGHAGPVSSLAFSPTGLQLVSGGSDGTVRIWNASSGKEELQPSVGHTGGVFDVAFSPSGRLIASGGLDGTVRVWRTDTGSLTQTLTHQDGSANQVVVAFGNDDNRLASAGTDGAVRVWNTGTGMEAFSFADARSSGACSVAFSPDGQYLASGGEDSMIHIWRVWTRQRIRTLSGHTENVVSLEFSKDGRRLVSGAHDNTVRLWDLETGNHVLFAESESDGRAHEYDVRSVKFSPDGRRILSASADGTVKVWDTVSHMVVLTLDAPDCNSAVFSPDGSRVAFGGGEGTVTILSTTREDK